VQPEHDQFGVERLRATHQGVVVGFAEGRDPLGERFAIGREVLPRIEIDAGDELIVRRVGEQPCGVGAPDALHREDQLGFGQRRHDALRLGHQLQQLGASRNRRLADQRDLLVHRERAERILRRAPVATRERKQIAHLRRQLRNDRHRANVALAALGTFLLRCRGCRHERPQSNSERWW
jgi:hypothetical protein